MAALEEQSGELVRAGEYADTVADGFDRAGLRGERAVEWGIVARIRFAEGARVSD